MSILRNKHEVSYDLSEQEEVLSSFSEASHASSDFSVSNYSSKKAGKWSLEEDELLRKFVEAYGQKNWKQISSHIPGKTSLQCLHRFKRFSMPGYVKGTWSKEEDQKLLNWVKTHGSTNWAQACTVIIGRTGKQIRERWFNHLNPNVKRNAWSPEEDEKLFELYQRFGTSWSKIAKSLPGRAENAIKNRYYSTMRKINSDQRKAKTDAGIIREVMEDDESVSQTTLYRILLASMSKKSESSPQVNQAPSLMEETLNKQKVTLASPILDSYKENMVSSQFDGLQSEGDDYNSMKETFKVNSLQNSVFNYVYNNVNGLKNSVNKIKSVDEIEPVCMSEDELKKIQMVQVISKRINEMQDNTIFSNDQNSMFNGNKFNPQKMNVMYDMLSSLEALLKITKQEIGSLETSLEREGKTGLEDMFKKKIKIDN